MGESKLFALMVVMVLATCGNPAGPAGLGEQACAFPDLDVSGWEVVDRPGFSFRIPPGFEKLDLQPIDSDAARYETQDGASSLSYDFGFFSADIDEDEADCTARIGGFDARVAVVNTQDRRTVSAFWPELPNEGPALGDELALRMDGEAASAEELARLLAAIGTVEIE